MKSFNRLSSSVLVSLAGLSGLHAAGDSPAPAHESPLRLDNIVVTATPFASSQADLAQAATVLSGPALQERQQASLGETLANEPGMSSTYFGPGASRPLIRGMGADRVRLLQNGSATLDASTASPDHAVSIEPFLVKRIEVVRGPASLLYGSSAVGGVINVISHRIEDELPTAPMSGEVMLRHDSASQEWTRGAVADTTLFQRGKLALVLHLDGYRRDTADLGIPGRALRSDTAPAPGTTYVSGTLPNSSVHGDGGALGLSLVGERGFIGLAYSGYNTNYGVPGAELELLGQDTPAGGVRIDLHQRRLDLQGELRDEWGPFRTLRFKYGHADYTHRELEADGNVGTRFVNRGEDARMELTHTGADEALNGAFGVQMGDSRVEVSGEEAFLPPTKTRTLAGFAFEEYKLGRLRFQTGARAERQSIDLPEGGEGRNDTLLSGSLALLLDLPGHHGAGLTLSRSTRAPNAQELFADGPHAGTQSYEIGDRSLGRERVTHLEASLRRKKGFVTGELSLFGDFFSNYLFDEATGETAVLQGDTWKLVPADTPALGEETLGVYRYRQDRARFLGAELDTFWHLHAGDRHSLDLRLGADCVRAQGDGQDLPRIPPYRTIVGLEWRKGLWTIGADWQHGFAQNRTAPNETRAGSYEQLSARVACCFTAFGHDLDVFLKGGNLLDREIRPHSSYLKDIAPLPGRSLSTGLTVHF